MRFSKLAAAYEKIEATSGRIEMSELLGRVFKQAEPEEAKRVVYLTQGKVAPPYEGIEVGMGEKFVEQAISIATGYSRKEVENAYRASGDLGKVAEKFVNERKQSGLASEELSVERVFNVLRKIAITSGAGSQSSKVKALAELLNSASPVEAKFIVRFPLSKLRLGVGDPTIIDALSMARKGDKSARKEIERAYNLCSDLGSVAESYLSDERLIRDVRVRVFSPIRPALAERLPSAEEILKKLGRCVVEAKYDGFRMQVHKSGERVEIFSRKLERMTPMFPEIVEGIKRQVGAEEAILEGEALAFNSATGQYFPFQMTIQRKRKHGVKEMAEKYPLHLFVFDLLYADGKDYTKIAYAERKKKLKEVLKRGERISIAEGREVSKPSQLEAYFEEALEKGLEGVIAKDLKAPYVAGAREFAWIKLKRSYRGELSDSVDLVIVGYYLGKGARAEFEFGGLLCAVLDENEDRLKTVARIGSGFSEEEMRELKGALDKIKLKERPKKLDALVEPDVWVEPKYVITVAADEITRSPMHTCGKSGEEPGYALRFPRMVQSIRRDKGMEDATTVYEILKMYDQQRRISWSNR
ncbi:DNA ligase [Candidatus Micrarchaeota archaeon]|nr:MAG: DNA ligase [Candidatus Micrarchaeota archaeon]